MYILSEYTPQGFKTCLYEKYAFPVRTVKMSLLYNSETFRVGNKHTGTHGEAGNI